MSDERFGIYPATVVNNADPEKGGRITVLVPLVLGSVPTSWAMPCWPPGWSTGPIKDHTHHVFTDDNNGQFSSGSSTETLQHSKHELVLRVPAVGANVWVMFVGGDVDQPVWMGCWK